MKKSFIDFRLYIGFFLAHVLLFLTYTDSTVFWYLYSASMLILISFSILKDEIDDALPFFMYITLGIFSGLFLFGLFLVGATILKTIYLPIQNDIDQLYKLFSPSMFWHYLTLMLIAVPGEEIFWRGFIQKRLLKNYGFWSSILISSVMYASASVYSGEWILIIAALIAGFMWGYLYAWKRSIPLVIVSHLVFDLLLFILYPI